MNKIFLIFSLLVGVIYAGCTITDPDLTISDVIICVKNVNSNFLSKWVDPTKVSGTVYNVTLDSIEGPALDNILAMNDKILTNEFPISYMCDNDDLATTYQIRLDAFDTNLNIPPYSCSTENFTFSLCGNNIVDFSDAEECDFSLDTSKCTYECLCKISYLSISGACCEGPNICNIDYDYTFPEIMSLDFSFFTWNISGEFDLNEKSMTVNNLTNIYVLSSSNLNGEFIFDAINENSNSTYTVLYSSKILINNTVFKIINLPLGIVVDFSIITESQRDRLVIKVNTIPSAPTIAPTKPDGSKAIFIVKIIIFIVIIVIAALLLIMICMFCTYCCFKKKCKVCKKKKCKCISEESTSESDVESSKDEIESSSDETESSSDETESSSDEDSKANQVDESSESSHNFNKVEYSESSENVEYFIEESSN